MLILRETGLLNGSSLLPVESAHDACPDIVLPLPLRDSAELPLYYHPQIRPVRRVSVDRI